MNSYLDINTSFLTPEGRCTFKHFRDGEKVRVLSQRGNWISGTVKAFGRKPLHLISLQGDNPVQIASNPDARLLLRPQGRFVRKIDPKNPKTFKIEHHICDTIAIHPQYNDQLFSHSLKIFSGDDLMYHLVDENYILHSIEENFKSCDAWGIELKEDFFFTLSYNILFGSC